MAILKDTDQLTLIYNRNNDSHKRCLAYFQETEKPLLEIDTQSDTLTQRQWAEILDTYDGDLTNIFDQQHEILQDFDVTDTKNDTNDLFKILRNNPDVLLHPILLEGEKVHVIKHPYDFSEFVAPDGNDLTRDHAEDMKRD